MLDKMLGGDVYAEVRFVLEAWGMGMQLVASAVGSAAAWGRQSKE